MSQPPALPDMLTRQQIELLAEKLARVMAAGYGQVAVVVKNGVPRHIVSQFSERMPYTPGEDPPEARGDK